MVKFFPMPSTILVTGASGFVGRAVVPRLQEAGHRIKALSRTPGKVPASVEPLIGNIESEIDWAPRLAGVDTVVHLAARVHVMHETAGDPLARFRSLNRDATVRLATGAARAGVRRFVFVSSIKVNGEATTGTPFRAGDRPAPLDPYGVSKWEAEERLREVAKETGMEVVVIRPPLVHGAGAGGNLRRFLGLIARGFPLPFGAIRNSRRLVGVRNLADLLAISVSHPSAPGQVFLAGDAESVSTATLARSIGVALGRAARLVPVPVGLLRLGGAITGRSGEIDRLVGSLELDIGPTCSTLGWTPPLTFQEGITEMATAWRSS
jgi:UDP-N-acetyl-alpha-D-quinovosamine dehydrogenase